MWYAGNELNIGHCPAQYGTGSKLLVGWDGRYRWLHKFGLELSFFWLSELADAHFICHMEAQAE